MEILELNLKHFGRFEDYTLKLHAGVNVISGGNETGKSTLHAFIRAMFYGLTRNRARALDEYQLRQPWENPGYFAGSLKLLHEGNIYRIDRNFSHREETLEVVNETEGTKTPDPQAALQQFLAGLSETDFDNTVFIRQTGAATGPQLAERLRNFLLNVQQTGGPQTDVEAAGDFLKKRRRETEAKKKEALSEIETAIAKNAQETEYVNRDLERLLERMDEHNLTGEGSPAFERMDAGAEQAHIAATAAEWNAVDMDAADADAAEGDAPGDLLLPVLVLLCFAAAALSGACAFLARGLTLRLALGCLAGLFVIMGVLVLLRLLNPQTHAQQAEKRLRREAFLEKHLGFRDDPEDALAQERERERAQERHRRLAAAQERDRAEQEQRLQNVYEERLQRAHEAPQPAAGRHAQEQARSDVLSREVRTRRERLEELKKEQEALYDKKAGLGGYDQELRAIELADNRIRTLSGSLYRQSGEQFLEEASALLSRLTGGRYTSLSLDASLQLWINTPERLLKVTQVSYAAMNQVYLALRLAAGDLLTGGADLPLLLDEPFAMYDDERLETALSWLSYSGRQVVLFTCQRRELDLLAKLRA